MSDLRDRVALVTGGGIGIGRATALALAAAGADIAITYRTHEGDGVVKAAANLGRRAFALPVDVTDAKSVNQFVDEVVARLGRLDIVVANAGGLIGRFPVETMSDAHWRAVLDTNLSSAFYLARASLRHMGKPGGRIILISSMAAFSGGGAGAAAYAAAKAGMLGLTLALAKEVAPRGITVNAIAPGSLTRHFMRHSLRPRSRKLPSPACPLAGQDTHPMSQVLLCTSHLRRLRLSLERWSKSAGVKS
jgi:3-oxoacyl-[acyl-carrier protein] reductase